MPLINTSLPNMIQGVSQQPDSLRYDGQCTEQQNFVSSIVDGLSRRPETRHITELKNAAISANSKSHFINRSDTEKYLAVFTGDSAIGANKLFLFDVLNPTQDVTLTAPNQIYVSTAGLIEAAATEEFKIDFSTAHGFVVGDTIDVYVTTSDADEGAFQGRHIISATTTNTISYKGYTGTNNGQLALSVPVIAIGGTQTVNATADGYTFFTEDYLYGTNPNEDLKTLQVADTTFIVNTGIGVGMLPDTSPVKAKEALIFVKQGDYLKDYRVSLTGDFTSAALQKAQIQGTFNGSSYRSGRQTRYRFTCTGMTLIDGGLNYTTTDAVLSVVGADFEVARVSAAATQGLSQTGGSVNSGTVNVQPSMNYTIDSTTGTITSVSVNNAGQLYNGMSGNEGATQDDYNPHIVYGFQITEPTGASLYTQSGVNEIDISARSEDANDATHSDSIKIMGDLVSGGVSSDDFADNGITATSTGASDEFSLEHKKNLVILTRNPLKDDFDISTSDGLSNSGLGAAYTKVDAITSLPKFCKNGFRIRVSGAGTTDADDYYVKFETQNNADFGNGVWNEDVGFGVQTAIHPKTMPHQLISTGVRTFTLKEMTLGQRLVGDDISNPMPSFVGKNITDVFFYKNRLGILAEDNIIFSEAGLGLNVGGVASFNFFRTTVTDLLDSDPIDVSVSSSKVTNLQAAVSFQENLLIMSDTAQFILRGGELLTPSTVSIMPITEFEYNEEVRPVVGGSFIYFPFIRGQKSGIQEMAVNASTDVYEAQEITEHVPTYIPDNLRYFVVSDAEDYLFLVSDDTPNTVYVYKYFFTGSTVTKKLLSAFSKWTFPGDIRGFDVMDGEVYMIFNFNTGSDQTTQLVKMPLQLNIVDSGDNFNAFLDMRFEDTMTGPVTLTLPYNLDGNSTLRVLRKTTGFEHHEGTPTTSGTSAPYTTSVAPYTGDVVCGIPYTSTYTYSQQLFKAPVGDGKSPTAATKVQIRNGTVFFDDAQEFDVKITPDGRSQGTSTFLTSDISSAYATEDGEFKFGVFGPARGTEIILESDSSFNARFLSTEFESYVSPKSSRVR